MFSPKEMDNFLGLCNDLKSFMLNFLDSLDQTDNVRDIKNRLSNATVWNEIFDLSILTMGEKIKQLEEKKALGREHMQGDEKKEDVEG